MEEKAPLAHGDEQVWPITGAPFIVFLGFDRSCNGISKQQIELFALGIPDYDSETDPPQTDSPPPPPLLKQKLNPHVVVDLPRSIFFAALGSSIYFFSNVEAFDASCPFRCAPPPTVARFYPYTIFLDDKLYLLGGLKYDNEKARGNFHWMEVFDPKLGTWKTLTNPPVEISTRKMMVTPLPGPQNQILVIAPIWSSYGVPNCVVLTYDVKTDIWSLLDLCISKLFAGGSCELSSIRAPIPMVDGIFYWVKFGDCNDLVVYAYDIYNDDCFEGTLNMLQEVFGKREYLYQSCMAPTPLIHLCDHKFCLPLQSWTRNEKNHDRRHYLYCVVLNISPIFDGNEELHNDIRDLFNHKKLHVSVLSSEKYPMDHGVNILDTYLMNGSSLLSEASKAGARACKRQKAN
ncbi:uncharacterized protein LOC126706893 [Quercus robur]|uniref:uncharacterized protein LOC126706893 n=1 Tax=Quercus robur TaxID=38942 RepID=UPI0021637CAB|nr:uncharacterized protein LOC126706893 [Quercus robur]